MKRKRVGNLNHFEILNIHSTAGDELVGQAYLALTSIYGNSSVAPYGALEEDEKRWMLERIQKAYDTLKEPKKREEYLDELGEFDEIKDASLLHKSYDVPLPHNYLKNNTSQKKTSNANGKGAKLTTRNIAPSPASSETRITGAHLRNVRMARGASLDEIVRITKIKKSFLEAFEKDDFDAFPAKVFMMGFLKSYAKALGLNPEEISDKYFYKD